VRAVTAHGPYAFECAGTPAPDVSPGSRLVRVEATGVCAADRMLWHGTGPWQVRWPFVPGHEILGRDAGTGERLTVEVKVPCGQCRYCRAGRGNLCPRGRHIGSSLPGGFAELLVLPPEALVHPVPDELPRAAAVLAEPMACALHAVTRAAVKAGDTVAVIGLGAVGALAVVCARARLASRVLAVVRTSEKAELAKRIGAEPVAAGGAAARGVPAVEDAEGLADAVIECSGDPAAAATALALAAPGGRVCLYSVYPGPATVDLNQVSEFKELTVAGGHLAPGCFPEAIRLLAGVPAELHAAGADLADFKRVLDHPDPSHVKVALLP
jgi:threonine dehydrogenase-like Zn-dependent dehydrogenase